MDAAQPSLHLIDKIELKKLKCLSTESATIIHHQHNFVDQTCQDTGQSMALTLLLKTASTGLLIFSLCRYASTY